MVSGWRRSALGFNEVAPVKPHVFEREKVESCLLAPPTGDCVVDDWPDEHRLGVEDIDRSNLQKTSRVSDTGAVRERNRCVYCAEEIRN